MARPITVGFLTSDDPRNKNSWSGTFYRMKKALENEFIRVVILGPVQLSSFSEFMMNGKMKIVSWIHRFIFSGDYNCIHNHIRSKYFGRFFKKKLEQNKVDVIFAPAASVEIAHLKTRIPICYFSDATFAQINDYYQVFRGLSSLSIKIGNEIEQAAIKNSTTQVFPSNWALTFAKERYKAQRGFVAKMGANIDRAPNKDELRKQYGQTANLLFIGLDWHRKGGDIVYQTIIQLDERGIDFHLTVCGCVPPQTHPKMTIVPFLDKDYATSNTLFHQLFCKSHILFMPTRAECYGIVFCEANAYGLPVITTDTGGVTAIIEDGINGFTLPLQAGPEEYAFLIERLIKDETSLKRMSQNALLKYHEELNWKAWGQRMVEILRVTRASED